MLISGDPVLETRQIENLHTIPLRVECSTLDFDMNSDGRREAFDGGELHAEQFFHSLIGHQDPEEMSIILRDCRQQMINALRLELGLPEAGQIHLRSNIIMETTHNTLRVIYSSGMEDDPDDRLEFPIGSGACSRCFVSREPIICDLEEARKDPNFWKMDKYQQAMVRNTLRSLLCMPILDEASTPTKSKSTEQRIIAVLNFDSDDNILTAFAKRPILKLAQDLAIFVGLALTSDRRVVMRSETKERQ
jgi:hypothetical protein